MIPGEGRGLLPSQGLVGMIYGGDKHILLYSNYKFYKFIQK